jgi:hypothetical protein
VKIRPQQAGMPVIPIFIYGGDQTYHLQKARLVNNVGWVEARNPTQGQRKCWVSCLNPTYALNYVEDTTKLTGHEGVRYFFELVKQASLPVSDNSHRQRCLFYQHGLNSRLRRIVAKHPKINQRKDVVFIFQMQQQSRAYVFLFDLIAELMKSGKMVLGAFFRIINGCIAGHNERPVAALR